MIGMLCTASWGPSQTIQTALRCPRPESSALTSHWTGCRLCFVVDLVEPFHEHESSQLASQQNVVILEFGSPCSPRSALFARDLIRHSLQQVAPFYHELFRLQRWSWCFHDKNVFGNRLAHYLCEFQQRVAPFYHVPFQRGDSCCLRWTRLGCSCFNNGLPRSIVFDSFFMTRTCIDLLGTGRFSSILHGSRVSSDNGLPQSIGSNNGLPRSIMTWVWNWLVRLDNFELLHNLSFWSLSIFWTQFCFTVMFQGDLWRRPRWRIYFLVYDFSSFHLNNFRNTISWKCFVKNDRVRSSLIER